MKNIHLHGKLGKKFGKLVRLAVESPAEAIRAIEARTSKLYAYLASSSKRGIAYRIVIGGVDVTDVSELTHRYGDDVEDFHFYPVPRGSKGGILAVFGFILLAIAVVWSGGTVLALLQGGMFASVPGFIAHLGVMLIMAGVTQMVVGTPKIPDMIRQQQEGNPSYFFNGPVNTSRTGGAIPLGYGQMIVGSQVISLAIRTFSVGTGGRDLSGGGNPNGKYWNPNDFVPTPSTPTPAPYVPPSTVYNPYPNGYQGPSMGY